MSAGVRIRTRAGLALSAAAALRGGPAAIAYLGGSVTAQRPGYVGHLHALLCDGWGQPHQAVRAGVGGMGSIAGVFLTDELVLARTPTLCFVEFTTTDAGGATPHERVGLAAAAIVAKLSRAGCGTCFLHLPRADAGAAYAAVRDRVEAVADQRAVPSVDVSEFGAQALRDVVHTTPSGAEAIAAGVAGALLGIAPVARPATEPDAPLLLDARTEPAGATEVEPCGATREGRYRLTLPYVEIAPGSAARRTFAGELWGLVVIAGPRSGLVRISAAGRSENLLVFDEYCHYERLTAILLEDPCPAGADVVIAPLADPVDRTMTRRPVPPEPEDGTALKLVAYMVRPC